MEKSVLLVDDEPHMLRLLQFALKGIHAGVHCIKSGEEALTFLGRNRANVVLLDYSMPGKDGVETLQSIRSLPGGADIKVIMLTARDQTAIRKDAAGLNVEAYLTKPFSPSDLARRVTALLDSVPSNS